MNKIIVIDGCDGTGKSTLVQRLRDKGWTVQDRGLPTFLAGDANFKEEDDGQERIYFILDVDTNISQARLVLAGKSLNEPYHNKDDLIEMKKRFRAIAADLPNCHLIDASGDANEVYNKVITIIWRASQIEKPVV